MNHVDERQGTANGNQETSPGDAIKQQGASWRKAVSGWREAKWHDIVVAGATCVIAAVGIFQLIVYLQMKTIMRSSGQQTQQLIDAANIQADAAEQIADSADRNVAAADKFASHAEGIKTQTEEAVKRLERMASASEDANTENRKALAATLKQGTDALNQAIEQSRLDERPWAVVREFNMPKEPTASDDPEIRVWIINTGKTPAIRVLPQAVIMVADKEPSYDWFSYQMLVEATHSPSRGILPPGAQNFSFAVPKRRLSTDELRDYTSQKSNLYVQAIVRYEDVWDRAHWTTICSSHVFNAQMNEWKACERGNNIDHGK